MTRKRCKRKVYALIDTLTHAKEGAAITPEATLNKVRLLELAQIDAFAIGKPTLADLRGITEMLNVCETMADTGIGPEASEACQEGEKACLAVMKRFENWGKLEATKDEIQAFRELFAWHDAQRSAIPRSIYERAIQRTQDRIRSGHPSCKVIA